jgi:parvulin-like peptidyl-prolyl isomerase
MALLGQIRKRASGIGIKVIFGLIALTFVIGFGILPNIGGPNKEATTAVIEAGKTKIDLSEFLVAYNQTLEGFERAYGGQIPKAMLEDFGLKQRLVEALKTKAVLLEQARLWGLEIPDAVLGQEIQKAKAFQTDGRFDPARYRATLRSAGMTPERFEEAFRRDLVTGWVEQLIDGLAILPEPALQAVFEALHHKRVFYAIELQEPGIPPEQLDETRLKAYFLKNKETFRVPKRVRAEILAFEPILLLPKVHPDPKSVEAYYRAHIEEFKEPKRWRIAQILVKDEAKAKEVRSKITKGERFEDLAKAFSEDEASAKKGGDVGEVRAAALNPSIRRALFRLKEGETSEPIRVGEQFILIKALKILPERTPKLQEVQGLIAEILKRHEADKLAKSMSEKAYTALKATKSPDLRAYGSQHGIGVFEAELTKQEQPIKGLGYYPDLNKRLLMLEQEELTGPIATSRGYCIAYGKEVEPSLIPPFEAVRDEVRNRLHKELAQKGRSALIERLSRALASSKDPEGLLRQEGMAYRALNPFGSGDARLEPLGELPPGLGPKLFALSRKTPVLEEPVTFGGKNFLLVLKDTLKPPKEAYQKEREHVLNQTQQELRASFLARFVRAFEKMHKVKVNERALERI